MNKIKTMLASHSGNDSFLEQRYEYYLELGYSPSDAAKKAQEDLSQNNFIQLAKGGIASLEKGGSVEKKSVPISGDELKKILEDFMKQQEQQEKIRKESKAMGGRIGFAEGGGMPSSEKIQQMRRILFGLLDNPDILVLPDRDIFEMYLNLDQDRKQNADGGFIDTSKGVASLFKKR